MWLLPEVFYFMPYHDDDDLVDRKERKQEKKTLSRRDRSQFKKTDASQQEGKKEKELAKLQEKNFTRGRVLAVLPEEIVVDVEGKQHTCTLKGALKKEISRVKNLCVVGDFVLFDLTGGIVNIEKRRTQLSRVDPKHTHKMQLIASNIDQVLITVAALAPPLKPFLIDRFIIAAQKGEMTPIVVITKMDKIEKGSPLEAFVKETVDLYRHFGFTTLTLSSLTGEGMEELKMVMQNKASVFSGESGVGKSSLINAMTGLSLLTQEVSTKTQRGTHTTVRAKLVPLICGGFCIDTPGIQSFGLWDLKKEDLRHYFSDITEKGRECKYPNCSHSHEPSCAVRQAVLDKEIYPQRFASYLELLKEIS